MSNLSQTLLLAIIILFRVHSYYVVASPTTKGLEIVPREGWHAKLPKQVTPMTNPVPFVIIHHSYIPPACSTETDCINAMQSMQNYHQNDRGWDDIGYSFGVGGDNRAYTGRGWSAVGAHAPKYNDKSIGICVIGDWRVELPPSSQLETVKELIQFGVDNGYISPDYQLLGHRQVRETECPGDALFSEIQTWKNWIPVAPTFYRPEASDDKKQLANAADTLSSFLTKIPSIF